MLLDYLNERYTAEDLGLSLEQAAAVLPITWKEEGVEVIETEHGFVTYQLKGDALLILDVYVVPEKRGHTHMWELHEELMKRAKAANKTVAITFADVAGKNHLRGIGTMKVTGFKPAYKTSTGFVFIKGIN